MNVPVPPPSQLARVPTREPKPDADFPWTDIKPAWLVRFVRETAIVLWRVGDDGYVVDIPQWAALTGQSNAELQGEGWMSAVHPDDQERVRAAWTTAVTHQSAYNTDYRLRRADGIYRWVNARGIPILDDDGEVVCWIGAIFGIAGLHRFGRSTRKRSDPPATEFIDITAGALRAARALLGWSADRLSESSGVSTSTIRRLEGGADSASTVARSSSVAKILKAFAEQPLILLGEQQIVKGVLEKGA